MQRQHTHCTVEGCGKPHACRGFCQMHYSRFRRTGDAGEVSTRRLATVDERFWAKVEKTDTCWLWTGGRNRGYGTFNALGKTTAAHLYLVGAAPAGMNWDHTCHNWAECHLGELCPHRRCVRPEHLELVTARTNTLRGNGLGGVYARRTHCARGHTLGESRICMECQRARNRAYATRVRARVKATKRLVHQDINLHGSHSFG